MKQLLKLYCLLATMFFISCSGSSDSEDISQPLEVKIVSSNSYPAVGEPVEMTIQAISGSAVSAEWNWGDGAVTQGINGTHQYAADGNYTLILTAKDNSGQSVSVSEKIEVEGTGLTKFVKEFDRNHILITAHRGNTGDKSIPENSMAAIDACIANKDALDFIEIDPRTTKDGVMVLMHDATVDRTTNGTGKISDLTFAEVQKLRLKLDDGTVTDHQVPTLQEVLIKTRGKVFINLDFINNVSPKEAYELVRNCGMLDRVLFTVGTKKDVAENMLGYGQTIHILGQYSDDGDENYLASAGGGGRIAFVYITPAKALSTGYADLLWEKGFITATNLLNQNGFSYDSQMLDGNYTGINLILAKNYRLLQTDYPKTLHAYLKSQSKR